jgi:iron complex transport system substrate-binding protein
MNIFSLPAAVLIAGLAAVAPFAATDLMGRTVNAPPQPQRIVVLAPSLTETVYALGCGGLVAGVTKGCDFPAEAQKLPVVGDYVNISLERLAALKPDLVLATFDGNSEYIVEKLYQLKIPVFVCREKSLAEIKATLRELGKLLGRERPADSLRLAMDAALEKVRARTSLYPRGIKVLYAYQQQPLISPGRGTFANELLDSLGVASISRDVSAGYPRISPETVLELDPELILISTMSTGADTVRIRREWQAWKGIRAVRNNRIRFFDSRRFDRPSVHIMQGVMELQDLIIREYWKQ